MILRLVVFMAAFGVNAAASEFGDLFEDQSLTVCVRDVETGDQFVHNADRAAKRFTAYSTFKIPNSIIALETGAVEDSNEKFAFDPSKHRSDFRKDPNYNRDQTLPSAFRHSVVWTFQEIAKRVGPNRYADYLERFQYGNQDLSGGIDRFWLSSLEISAIEQVEILARFYNDDLELKPETNKAVKSMMLLEETDAYRLHGKTGTGMPKDGTWSGWLVGFVEAADKTFIFAIHADADSYPALQVMRLSILKDSMTHLGVPMNAEKS